jgi:hypothetical protein
LPKEPITAIPWISQLTCDVAPNLALAEGGNWSYRIKDIEDIEMKQHYEGFAATTSQGIAVFAWDRGDAATSLALNLTIKVLVEYVTNSENSPNVCDLGDRQCYEMIVKLMHERYSNVSCVGSNGAHLDRAKAIAMSIASNPTVKLMWERSKGVIKAGVKAAAIAGVSAFLL